MRPATCVLMALAIVLGAAAARDAAAVDTVLSRTAAPDAATAFAGRSTESLATMATEPPVLMARITGGGRQRGALAVLTVERARAMLQSLTVPGWGQLASGHRGAAKVFGVLDAGIWSSFVAFEVQQRLRVDASLRTARLFAGIDLSDRSEEFRRIVGSYPSSDDYNVFVVYRDAANLYYNDPAAYRDYIAHHEIGGAESWAWQTPESYDRYRAQRKDAQRAGLRANTALALAIANRLISAVHAASVAHKPRPSEPGSSSGHAFHFEVQPDFSRAPVAVRFGVGARF